MQAVAASINRSLAPALRESESLERWYRQPPSNIRSYEWAPLIAALISTLIAYRHHAFGEKWLNIWIPAAAYYLYLIADLSFIRPARMAKWLRNSMPIWFILIWHYPLVKALGVPAGQMNGWLAGAVLAAFFPFFWEDYYTLQKFVRGLVVVYYFSLALLLRWPYPLGLFVSTLSLIIAFNLRYRVIYYRATVLVMVIMMAVALILTGSLSLPFLVYAALGIATLVYLQTFITVAYDIRKAGNVALDQRRSVRQ